MEDLEKVLSDIGSIREQIARSTQFQGYGPFTLFATAVFAALAATAQAIWLADPIVSLPAYLILWTVTAAVSAGLIGFQMVTRSHRIHSSLADEMVRTAVEQFLPCIGAGALVTIVLVNSALSISWMLPGLWQIMFSLGAFASCRFLPRAMVLAAVWYLFSGLICLSAGEANPLSPYAMGIPFGVGQSIVAAVLYFSSRRKREN